METWAVELTDTFGGVANYSWVRRETLTLKANATNRSVARAAKQAMGYANVRGRSCWYGDHYEFRPYRECVVLFATFQYT